MWIPATETAREIGGTERATNMAALGAFLAAEPLVQMSSAEAIVREVVPSHRKEMVEKNLAVLRAGYDHVRS